MLPVFGSEKQQMSFGFSTFPVEAQLDDLQ